MSLATLLIVSFFALALLNIPIAVALGLSSCLCLVKFGLDMSILPTQVYSGIAKFVLLAVPFFILAGNIMEKSGISDRLIRFFKALVGHKRGGLIYVSIIASLFFAAISGSGPACVAALGSILIPAMEKDGYGREFPSALLATGGSIGTIIPPSIPFVMFGLVTGVSITQLFMAGILPGILFGVGLGAVSLFMVRNEKDIVITEKATKKEVFDSFIAAIPALLFPVIILGGIYSGIFSPTEAAAVACVYGLVVGIFVYRSIKLRDLYDLFRTSVISSGNIMLIIAGASLFAWFCATSGITATATKAVQSVASSQFMYLLLVNVILLIAGCFMDSTSAIYILCPILVPVAKTLGYDLVALGVVFIVNLAIGNVTPPVGLNLFCACGVGNVTIMGLVKKVWPMLIVCFFVLILITYVPQISLFLPHLFYGTP